MILRQKGQESWTKAEYEAKLQVQPGVTLYGYCCGIFGRDSYGDKTVISVAGNTLICKTERGVMICGDVHSWIDLITSSNEALAEYEGDT